MTQHISVDPEALRADVRDKQGRSHNPHGAFHFHTGRPLAALLGYDPAVVDALPDRAVESFAGVGNPHSLRPPDGRRPRGRSRIWRGVRLLRRGAGSQT
ncbi:hypothetical protein BH23ACT2_BH23ACT2_09020 [soil metagenome]